MPKYSLVNECCKMYLYLPLRASRTCDLLGISLARNFNLCLILMRCSLVQLLIFILHALWLMALMMMALNHTLQVQRFLAGFPQLLPKTFLLTILHVDKGLSFETVERCHDPSCSLQQRNTAPFTSVSSLCSSGSVLLHPGLFLTLSLCEKCRAISKVNKVIFCQAEKTKEMPVKETVPENKMLHLMTKHYQREGGDRKVQVTLENLIKWFVQPQHKRPYLRSCIQGFRAKQSPMCIIWHLV